MAQRTETVMKIGLRGFVRRTTGVDPRLAPVDRLTRALRSISADSRRTLVGSLKYAVCRQPSEVSEDEWISQAKLLLALLPETTELVRGLLGSQARRDAELQFSLFCFLEELTRIPTARSLTREVPGLVETFVAARRTDWGMAAWMAGDLIGDHWPKATARRRLERVLNRGKFAAGRRAAIHGLAHLWARERGGDRDRLAGVLRRAAKGDRDAVVRQAAQSILDGTHSCAQAPHPRPGSRLRTRAESERTAPRIR